MGSVRWRSGWPVRLVAAATTAYSVSITVAPKLMAKPLGLVTDDGTTPATVASLTRSIGVRDAALAVALLVAPTGYPMSVLTAARAVSDGADSVWLSRIAPAEQRAKVVAVSLGWASLEVLTALFGNRTRR